jgi:hypothetical protein
MESGLSVKEAAFRAMKDIHELNSFGGMNCIAMDSKGNTISATTVEGRESVYYFMDVNMKESEKRVGITVPE